LLLVLGWLSVSCRAEKNSVSQDAAAISVSASPEIASSSLVADAASDAASDSGPTLSDAANAGSREWRVLVPKSVPDDSSSGDPRDAIVRAVAREVTAARADRAEPARVVIYADTTIDYGCLCPPFVLAPFWNTGRTDGTFYPIYPPGVPEPMLAKQGLYRILGHFDGRRISGFEWLKMRGAKTEEGMDAYADKAPVLVVEGWCFEPNATFSDPALEKVYRPTLVTMEKEGRFCPGTHMPARAPR
jgi:hypothetical protein